MEAPSADDLQSDPTVRAAFAAVWPDSFPEDPLLRHEESGFIYYNPGTGTIAIRRTPPGWRSELDLSKPPLVRDSFLVAIFHTHPNAIGFMPDPSREDHDLADDAGIPFFTISEKQTMSSVLTDVSADAPAQLGTRFESYEEARSAPIPHIDVHEALMICHADGLSAYEQLHHYGIELFLEKDGWHINYGIKQRHGSRVAGGGPHYVIDASTGKILRKKYYQ